MGFVATAGALQKSALPHFLFPDMAVKFYLELFRPHMPGSLGELLNLNAPKRVFLRAGEGALKSLRIAFRFSSFLSASNEDIRSLLLLAGTATC